MSKVGNRNYKRGREFEYKTRDHLINEMGAVYVMRAAQSKGAADLIALFTGNGKVNYPGARVYLVQCKRDGKLPRATLDPGEGDRHDPCPRIPRPPGHPGGHRVHSQGGNVVWLVTENG